VFYIPDNVQEELIYGANVSDALTPRLSAAAAAMRAPAPDAAAARTVALPTMPLCAPTVEMHRIVRPTTVTVTAGSSGIAGARRVQPADSGAGPRDRRPCLTSAPSSQPPVALLRR
jgi:hypothetical protein